MAALPAVGQLVRCESRTVVTDVRASERVRDALEPVELPVRLL